MRDVKFRGRVSQGLENAGTWIYWGINGTDILDCVDLDTIGQYTGLKDRNGVEIYEGDILNISPMGAIGEVGYHNGEYFAGIMPMGRGEDRGVNCGNSEVIGNIYENAELFDVSD